MDRYWNEKWKNIEFDENISEREIYKVSNFGRIKSFKVDKKNGLLLSLSSVQGYERLKLNQKSNKKTARFTHKLVAQAFIPKDNESQEFVIHLDYDKKNNKVINLRWASHEEKEKHRLNNPEYNDPSKRRRGNSKLTETEVIRIKRMINNPRRKTRLKIIAKQFGISEMQLHRIKTGENWGHVKYL